MADFKIEGIIEVDASRALRDLKKFKTELKGTYDDLRRVKGEIDAIDGRRVNVSVDVEIDDAGIEKLRTDLESIKDEKVFVDIETKENLHDLALQVEQIKNTVDAMGDAEIGVDLDGADAIDDMAALRAELDAMDNNAVEFKVEMANSEKVIADAMRLRESIAEIMDDDGDIDFDLELKGAAEATADLDKFKKAADGATSSIGYGKVGLVGALVALVSTLGPISAVLTGVAGGMVSSATVMGVSLGAFAAFAIPTFKEIAEAAKLLGTETKDMSAEEFKAFNQQLADLKKESPGIYKAAEAFGKLKDEYMGFAEQLRPIALDVFYQGIEAVRVAMKGMFPVAKQAGKGIRDLLKSATQNLNGEEWQAFFKYLKNNARDFIKVWGQTIGNFITGIANMIRAFDPLTKWVNKGFLGMSQSFRRWSNGLSENQGFQKFVDYVKTNGPVVWDAFKTIGKGIYEIFKFLSPLGEAVLKTITAFGKWASGAGELQSSIGNFIEKLKPVLKLMGENFMKILEALEPVLTKVFDKLGEAADALKPFFEEVGKLIDVLAPVLVPILKFLVDILGNALVGVIEGVTAVIKGIRQQFEGWKDIIEGVMAIFRGDFKEGFAQVWEGIKGIFKGALNIIWGLLKTWFNVTILNIFRSAGARLLGSWKGMWNAVKNFAKGAWNWIKNGVKSFGQNFGKAWGAIWKNAKALFQNIWNIIKNVAMAVWNFLKGKIGAAIRNIWNVIKNVLGAIKNSWKLAWEGMKVILKTIWDILKSTVKGGVDKVKQFVSEIPGKIKGVFAGAGNWLLDAGKAIIQGLLDGINSLIGQVTDKLNWLTDKLPDWKGPASKDRAILRPAGRMVMEGLIGGIDGERRALMREMKQITNDLALDPTMKVSGALGGINTSAIHGNVGSGGGTTIIQNTYKIEAKVPLGTSRAQVGKEIVSAIEAFEDAGGRKKK